MREFIIYCDESDKDGKYFANFYGGALVRSADWDSLTAELRKTKEELNLKNELKWQRVTENYLSKYQAFIDVLFKAVSDDRLKIRVMFTHRRKKPVGLSKEQIQNSFFLLYYQFVKHSFGLRYSNEDGSPTNVRLYFDRLPDTKEKCELFKRYISNLENVKWFKESKLLFKQENVAEVDSHEHPILEGLDIVLGAMAFRLNEKHKEIPPGQRKRGKRTVAKEKLYKHILGKIRALYPNFNIGVSTGRLREEELWKHPYRHWCFEPRNFEIDTSASKSRNKKAPSPLRK